MTLDGSGVLHPYAENLQLKNELITVEGGGHGNFTPEEYLEMDQRSSAFLSEILCGGLSNIEKQDIDHKITAFPNPSVDQILIKFSENPGPYNLRIYSIEGRLIRSEDSMDKNELIITKEEVNTEIAFVNIVFHNQNILPVNRKIIFSSK